MPLWLQIVSGLISGIIGFSTIAGGVYTLIRWFQKQNLQDTQIKQIKKEQTIIFFALSACLEGLMQLGANHIVPDAKEKLDKFINQAAHDQLKK